MFFTYMSKKTTKYIKTIKYINYHMTSSGLIGIGTQKSSNIKQTRKRNILAERYCKQGKSSISCKEIKETKTKRMRKKKSKNCDPLNFTWHHN